MEREDPQRGMMKWGAIAWYLVITPHLITSLEGPHIYQHKYMAASHATASAKRRVYLKQQH